MLPEIVDKPMAIRCFCFLDNLRASGRVNMFGAAMYLEVSQGVNSKTARAILGSWMETFAPNTAAEDRVEQAFTA